MTTKKISVTRAAGIVGFFTLLSRIFGLVRDVVFAAFIDKFYTDVFFIAFTIPNVLRRLLAEGALTISFIPVFTDYRKKSDKEAAAFVSAAFTATAVVVLLIALAGVLLAWPISMAFAWGYRDDPLKFGLVVDLTRIMFPYILFVSLMALAMGVLNTLGHFMWPAAAPILLNVALIASAVAAPKIGTWFGISPIYILAWGVLLGGVLQFLVQLPPMAKRGYSPRPLLDFKHPGVQRILKLMGPALFGLAIYQLTVMISRLLASFLGDGAVSYLYYSQRLIEFPMGVFAVAIATGAMPKMAAHVSSGEMTEMKETLRHSLELAQFVILPSMVGLIVIAEPVVAMFFQRGVFTHSMTVQTAHALMAFAAGLPAMAVARNVVPAFYALHDSKTPVRVSMISLIAYLAAGLTLMWPLKHVGLALAISISAWVNAIGLLFALRKKIGLLTLSRSFSNVTKMAISAAAMGGVAYGISLLGQWERGGKNLRNMLVLLGALSLSGLVYGASTLILGLPHSKRIAAILRGRLRGRKSA
ncbi:murein biosynthesis integral membrane protein MurJ [Myxococcota bacterium]|nr:murein biosynthesis integral membrane protein MurJ [Myxococcota bacterium]MBU1536676.1 murein biosynthesis integral membrane protein MurJ [Myxococcota bacterium]